MKVAYVYAEGRGGTPTDYTEAYKWYDIAAEIVGAKIDKLPVAASHDGEKIIQINYGIAIRSPSI
jgi:TPR repeat protein